MFRLFCGMVLGSLMTMVLLGGPSVANKVIQNAQSVFETQYAQSGPALTGYLLASLVLILISIASSITKQSKQTDLVIKKLRRYHPGNV